MKTSIETIVTGYLAHPKKALFLDIETTGLNPRTAHMVSVQLLQEGTGTAGKPVILDMRNTRAGEVGASLAPLFTGSLLIVGHNLKFDLSFLLEHYGIRAVRVFDTMLAEQVIYGAEPNKGYGLKAVADRRGIELYDGALNKGDRDYFINLDARDEWTKPFPDRIYAYMANDVKALVDTFKQQVRELAEKKLTPTAQLEFALVPVLVELERNGVHIDTDGWRAFIDEKHAEAERYREQVMTLLGPAILSARGKRIDSAMEQYHAWEDAREAEVEFYHTWWRDHSEEAGWEEGKWGAYKIQKTREWRETHPTPPRPRHDSEININSNDQIIDALTELGIPVPMKRKKGANSESVSVDEESLKTIEHLHEGIALLRKYRKREKFVKSYGEELLKEQDVDGRFHFAYNQIVSTGRMSASRIQQIPAKGEGGRLRQNVTAAPGCKLIDKDFNAAEMRILAEISRDSGLISIFTGGQDIHSSIARDLFDLTDDIDPKTTQAVDAQGRAMGKTYREIAKTVEYACVYGTGPRRLATVIGCDLLTARGILTSFLATYPAVEAYLARVKNTAITMGESRTLGGRARFYTVPGKPANGDLGDWKGAIASIERAAGNAPIQGSNADITKAAAVKLYCHLFAHGLLEHIKIIGIIHDEILLEAREEQAQDAGVMLAWAMEVAWNQYVKLVPVGPMEYTISDSWEH